MYKAKQNKSLISRVVESAKRPIRQIHQNGKDIIQFYTIEDGFKVSYNRIYKTHIEDTNELFVLQGGAPPCPQRCFINVGQKDGYNIFSYNTSLGFENDCGMFAEYLAGGGENQGLLTKQYDDDSTLYSGSIRLDAFSFPKAKQPSGFALNQDAKPSIQEAYFIGRTRKVRTGCNYHAATVVAQDGSDNITCEADAGCQKKEPCFDMYTTDNSGGGSTFHSTYMNNYSSGVLFPAFTTVGKINY